MSPTDSGDEWEDLGRDLAAGRLQTSASELQTAVRGVSNTLGAGEELGVEDIEKLQRRIDELDFVVDQLARLAPEARREKLVDKMTHDEIEEIAGRSPKRPGD